ncbi:exostosin domain-containing protein [Winogradskyella psychrotolerans]|uniref:exostosin domain-containing protein n=1 Tax=Winogradskyella psychrotolerans TaxID=1344585 RepID=UPI001C06D7D0|nr:exostosin family protein [Winogradskyella psychrotolerans]MBU2929544.1 exostosin family protein [Winogradskyella psychrotolerans]
MKLYYPKHHYNSQFRGQVFPLLKAYIKDNNFTDAQRIEVYGVSDRDFKLIENIANADVVILPMSWNYYIKNKQLNLAYNCIEEARENGKKVWSITTGDFGVKIPSFKNLTVFRQSGYVSRNQKGHCGFPSIIEDYLLKNNLEKEYLKTKYSLKPVVGFCGLAVNSKRNALLEKAKQIYRNLNSAIGGTHHEAQRIIASSYLRANLLQKLEKHKAIDNRFIIRETYRAGVTKNKASHDTTLEFYNNILNSQYVLCVRGAGNFSVRFYETLMMGRIPLYVHTDGFLPLSDTIDWKSHVVWVDYKDRHRIAEILLEFHQQLDQKQLVALCQKNRKLWEEKLTLSGFFETQKEYILKN